jgi:hypothetical protein
MSPLPQIEMSPSGYPTYPARHADGGDARMYLEFARSERVRYQVMFLPQLRDRKRFATLHATGGQALRLLAWAARILAARLPLTFFGAAGQFPSVVVRSG